MNVDRTRFLALTAALSTATAAALGGASGCSSSSPAATTQDGGVDASADSANPNDDAASEASADASACLGDVPAETDGGDAGDCNATDCANTCAANSIGFKAGVAASANACLLALPTCESADTTLCLEQALRKTCTDPAAVTLCAKLVAVCSPDAGLGADAAAPRFDQKDCEILVNGLNDHGRMMFTTCVTEGGSNNCSSDPASCITTFKQ